MIRSPSNRLQPTRFSSTADFSFSTAPRATRLALPVVLGLLMLVAGARGARAQDQAVIDRLVQLNKKAMDDFDTADFDASKKALLDAEKSGKKAGLETHPVMARTYIHLGAVYLIGFKDKQKAQHYFDKALDIQGDIRLDRNLTASALKDAFASAQARHAGGGAAPEDGAPPSGASGKKGRKAEPEDDMAPPATEAETESGGKRRHSGGSHDDSGGEPDLPKKIEALDCPYPNDTPPGKKLTLRCAAAPKMGIENVNLYYKGFEMQEFESVAMEKSPKGWWQAVLPKKVVDGKSLQFYFEGLDVSDQPVVSNGRAESPNVMLIVNRSGPKPKKRREEEDPLAEDVDVQDRKFGNRKFWFGFSIGSGVAFPFAGKPESLVNSYGDRTHSPAIPSALEWAGMAHLVPTIGYSFNPNWAIAIEGRNQFILRPKGVSQNVSASGAHAVLLRLLHYTKQQRTRLFWGVGGGGGEGIRGIVTVNPPPGSTTAAFQDTVLFGHILLTGGLGIIMEISKVTSLVAQGNLFFSLPNKGVVIDGTVGVQFGFGDASGRAAAAAKLRAESVAGSVDEEDPDK